ncbi:MAG: glycoside hydrolase family 10 protein [Acidobacteriota bacterium]
MAGNRGKKLRTCFLAVMFITLGDAWIYDSRPRDAGQQEEQHAIWCIPTDAGKTPDSVRSFVSQCKRSHLETIVMNVKGMNGELFWKSRRFPEAIAKGWGDFDLLENLVREAHAQGIKVHAWLVDFPEGAAGPAFKKHPEWAALSPEGKTTLSEKLGRTRPYPYLWMCPARRSGYVDQWFVPLVQEIVANYQVDGIHHDYARYPGDVAPDSYCFCDYCLAELPRHALLAYETRPEEHYQLKLAQPRVEANWWSDPTMLPANWAEMDRAAKADFLLNGRSIDNGPIDMRHYFYDYRSSQMDRFVREVTESVRRINPKAEVSAAVFKNPIQSGRFLGQHWERWNAWIDVYMPMTYRSHFAGSFEAYLDHLEEVTRRQREWIGQEKPLYAGIASTYLYREEFQPIDDMRERLQELQALGPGDQARAIKVNEVIAAFELLKGRLTPLAPETVKEMARLLGALKDGNPDGEGDAAQALLKAVVTLRGNLPAGFAPPEKLERAIEAARKANPEGIVIFSASNLTIEKLWPVLEKSFTGPRRTVGPKAN